MANGFLNDNNGDGSSGRLIATIWSLGILAVWVGICIVTDKIVDFPPGVLYVLGMVLTFLLFHKGIEEGTFATMLGTIFNKGTPNAPTTTQSTSN